MGPCGFEKRRSRGSRKETAGASGVTAVKWPGSWGPGVVPVPCGLLSPQQTSLVLTRLTQEPCPWWGQLPSGVLHGHPGASFPFSHIWETVTLTHSFPPSSPPWRPKKVWHVAPRVVGPLPRPAPGGGPLLRPSRDPRLSSLWPLQCWVFLVPPGPCSPPVTSVSPPGWTRVAQDAR